jgi:hypothetical protein
MSEPTLLTTIRWRVYTPGYDELVALLVEQVPWIKACADVRTHTYDNPCLYLGEDMVNYLQESLRNFGMVLSFAPDSPKFSLTPLTIFVSNNKCEEHACT